LSKIAFDLEPSIVKTIGFSRLTSNYDVLSCLAVCVKPNNRDYTIHFLTILVLTVIFILALNAWRRRAATVPAPRNLPALFRAFPAIPVDFWVFIL